MIIYVCPSQKKVDCFRQCQELTFEILVPSFRTDNFQYYIDFPLLPPQSRLHRFVCKFLEITNFS